jgi:hypothetical protein
MPTDLTVVLVNKPGSDAAAMRALGSAGINIDGVTGSGCGGEGILHILVADGASARRALESAGRPFGPSPRCLSARSMTDPGLAARSCVG